MKLLNTILVKAELRINVRINGYDSTTLYFSLIHLNAKSLMNLVNQNSIILVLLNSKYIFLLLVVRFIYPIFK